MNDNNLNLDSEDYTEADAILTAIRRRRAENNDHVLSIDGDYITWRRDCGEHDWTPRSQDFISRIYNGVQRGDVQPLSIEVTHNGYSDDAVERKFAHVTWKIEGTVDLSKPMKEAVDKAFDDAMKIFGNCS